MRTRIDENGQEVFYCRKCDEDIRNAEDVYQNEEGADVCEECSRNEE